MKILFTCNLLYCAHKKITYEIANDDPREMCTSFINKEAIVTFLIENKNLRPSGTPEDWMNFVINYKKKHNLQSVKGYYNAYNPKTNIISDIFLCSL